MLTVTAVTKSFGGLVAVDDVDLEIGAQEFVGLIGPNGAGKSTLFNLINGIYRPNGGSIEFRDREIVGASPSRIARLGVARTFQTPRTFNESKVLDNVLVGAIFCADESITQREAESQAREAIQFVGLEGQEDTEAGHLNLVERKLVELAKGVATDPDLVLVDEILAGLTPADREVIIERLERIREERDASIFWVEHVLEAVMESTDRVIVLHRGNKIADAEPEVVREDTDVREAYIGGSRP